MAGSLKNWQKNGALLSKILYQESCFFFVFFKLLVPGNLNMKFPIKNSNFLTLFSVINFFPHKKLKGKNVTCGTWHFFLFKLCLDNELSNIRTFRSITMLMLCLIHVKPICEKNIISNTFNPSFKGQNWRKIKNVTCGTFFSCFQIFLNNELSNIRTFYWFTFLMPCFIHKKQIFEKKKHF